LGLATGVPVLLARCDVYEVPISCGYMLTMLVLGAIWCALEEPRKRSGWLVVASVAYGLALGARPSLLFGGVILLVPVVQAWRERRRVWTLLVAAVGPVVLIGLGLLLYNALRFENPFEFGWHYQLASGRQVTGEFFNGHWFWFNFRVSFLGPAHWSAHFPFVHGITVPPLPAGYGGVERPFGVLTNIPLVWLALAVPLAWRGRSAETRSILCGFLAAVALCFVVWALTICFHSGATIRYEVEFLPTLLLLAVVGILGLERAMAPTSESGLANRRLWRRLVRWGWSLLLGFSVAFNLLAGVDRYAETDNDLGIALEETGRAREAIAQYEQAALLKPDYADAHNNLGVALEKMGRPQEAIAQYERALQIRPDYVEARYNLGVALAKAGKLPQAIESYEQALQLKPDYAEAQNNLGNALVALGRVPEAIGHWERALQLRPDFAETHNNLGSALLGLGRVPEAIEQYEQAVRLKPDYAKAHYNLGLALEKAGRVTEAIEQYEQAVQLKPDFTEAQNRLARLRAVQ